MRLGAYRTTEVAAGSQIEIINVTDSNVWNAFLVTAYADNPAYRAVAICLANNNSITGLFNLESDGHATFVVSNNKLYLKNDSIYLLSYTIRAIGF